MSDEAFYYAERTESADKDRTLGKFRARMARILAEDPEGCECPVCVRNWEEHG